MAFVGVAIRIRGLRVTLMDCAQIALKFKMEKTDFKRAGS